MPKHHRDLGLKVSTSNLCSEITLPTGKDHLGVDRTAVCCLSSLNLETWDEWNKDKTFIEDVMRFLDNVLIRLHRPRAGRDGARQVQRRPRAQRRPWNHGLPLLPPGPLDPVRGRDGEVVEPQGVQAYPEPGRPGVDDARQGARPLPGRRRHGRDGALQLQDGDRADRVHLDHLRRHRRPASSRSRPTSTRTRRCRAPSRSATRTSKSCSRTSRRTATRCGTRSSSRAARSSTSTS